MNMTPEDLGRLAFELIAQAREDLGMPDCPDWLLAHLCDDYSDIDTAAARLLAAAEADDDATETTR